MIRFLKYVAALLNAVVIGIITYTIVFDTGFPKEAFWVVVCILTVSSYCLYLTLSQAIMAGKNLPSAWINRKKAEQWAQIKKFSKDEHVNITGGKFGYLITTLVLFTFIYLSISVGIFFYSSYTEKIVVDKIERTDEEAKRLYEEDKRLYEDQVKRKKEVIKKEKGAHDLIDIIILNEMKYSKEPEDFKYKEIYGKSGFHRGHLIGFALFGLYGFITLPILFGSLFGRKEPNLIRLITEHKRLKEEARTRDLNI